MFVRHASRCFVIYHDPPVLSSCYQHAPELSILFCDTTNRQIKIHTDRHNKQADHHTQANIQTDKHTDKHTNTDTHTWVLSCKRYVYTCDVDFPLWASQKEGCWSQNTALWKGLLLAQIHLTQLLMHLCYP